MSSLKPAKNCTITMEGAEAKLAVQDRVINYLRSVVDNLEKENQKLQAKVEVCDCRKYNKSMHEVVQAASKHKEKVYELDKLLMTKKAVLKACRENMDELSNETEVLKEDINSKDHEIAALNKKNKEFEKEKENLNNDVVNLKHEVEVSKSIITNQMDSTKEFVVKNSILEGKIDLLENEISRMATNYEDEMKVIRREEEMHRVKLNEVVDENKSQTLKIVQLEQNNESLECEKIVCLRQIKDLEDEIATNIQEKDESKEENEDLTKSSSSSIAEELDFANKKVKKEKIHIEKKKMLERLALLAASNEEDFKTLKANIKKLESSNESPKCRFGKKCRRLFCRFSHRHLFVKVNNVENMKKKVSECVPRVYSSIANVELMKHLTEHTRQNLIHNPLISVSVENEEEEKNSETSSNTNSTESEFEETNSEESSDSSENETGEVQSDVSWF